MMGRQGWRYFECHDCEDAWRSTCRDAASQSTADCPQCGREIDPHDYEIDHTLELDERCEVEFKVEPL